MPRTRQELLQCILTGLRRLEYRGYDSAGVAIDYSPSDSSILIIKSAGRIDDLEAESKRILLADPLLAARTEMFATHAGIGHTRWATHGQPSSANAHPHTSGPPDYEFAVVHNGIITNYRALKKFLESNGEVFLTETDTEVIPRLCSYLYRSSPMDLPTLLLSVMRELEGAYALLIKSRYHPGELIACKKGSPLILGIGSSSEYYLASDASALVEHTKKVVVLEDQDVLHLHGGSYELVNATENASVVVSRALQTLEMEVSQIMKGGYPNFMAKEIHEQPESLLQTMRGRIKPPNTIKLGGLSEHLHAIQTGRRIMLVGCGTSYHACVAARPTLEKLVGLPVALELASDLLDRQGPIFRDDSCVFVSQSGETADTLAALAYAKGCGALCIGVTNTVGSALARGTHCGLHINAGAEIGVASTKAYTSQIVALTMMALALSSDSIKKKVLRDEMVDALVSLPSVVEETLASVEDGIRALAEQLKEQSSLLVFGRGYNYATAMEAALKVKEVALMHSEGILAGEMKHGPLALVDEHMPILVVATQDVMHGKMLAVLSQLRSRCAEQLIVLRCEGDDAVEMIGKGVTEIVVPRVADAIQPIVNIIPLQLLAYHIAVLRGLDVDRPRNLAKSVTVLD